MRCTHCAYLSSMIDFMYFNRFFVCFNELLVFFSSTNQQINQSVANQTTPALAVHLKVCARLGNKGAHTETTCQEVDSKYACEAVAMVLRLLDGRPAVAAPIAVVQTASDHGASAGGGGDGGGGGGGGGGGAAEPPEDLVCPITFELFEEATLLRVDGNTYEKLVIERIAAGPNPTSPLTREPFTRADLVPNRTVQRLADAWRAQHPGYGPVAIGRS